MSQYTVTFYPENTQIAASEGDNLLDIAKHADIPITSLCGGTGTCGKCKVIIKKGDVQTESTHFISQEEKEKGYCLACLTTVHSDLEVEVPPESRLEEEQILIDSKELVEKLEQEFGAVPKAEKLQAPFYLSPFSTLTTKLHLKLSPPTLEDSVDDLGRLFREIKRKYDIPIMQTGLKNLIYLGRFLRENDWDVTVLLGKRGRTTEVILLEPGDTSDKNYGIAVDVGTTTIVAHLIDLSKRTTVGTAATSNSQGSYGEDIITRIEYSKKQEDGLETLHRAVVKDINKLIVSLTRRNDVSLDNVTFVICAGNATMTQLLLGVDPTYIRREPYVTTANFFPVIRAAEAGIRVNRRALLSCMPSVASYVGGDIVAGALACGISESEEICLLIDIGTNGEMVLGNKDWLACCSCSCGPAFEGGGIEHGMRAARGAIQRIEIDSDYEVDYFTVGNARPRGICGSGLIDAIGEMLRAGVIDKAGKIQSNLNTPRYQETDEGAKFVLAWEEETAGAHGDITLSQPDIDNLVRSKAAVYAAVSVLTETMGLSWNDITCVYIAGAFGNYLDIPKTVLIGMLPDLPLEKFKFIGNSSIAGVKTAMLSGAALAKVEEIAKKMTYIELSTGNSFMEEFVAAQFLPHTDMTMFPSVTEKLSMVDEGAHAKLRRENW